MNQQAIITEFQKLPLGEKADLLDKLWSAYQREEEQTEFSTAELDELDGRMARYLADPSTATDADVVHARLRSRRRDAK
jgi:putative addiction module component (TIGR02574 family)